MLSAAAAPWTRAMLRQLCGRARTLRRRVYFPAPVAASPGAAAAAHSSARQQHPVAGALNPWI